MIRKIEPFQQREHVSKALASACRADIQPGVQRKDGWEAMRISKTYRTYRKCQMLWKITIISVVFIPNFGVRYSYHTHFSGEMI